VLGALERVEPALTAAPAVDLLEGEDAARRRESHEK
jgi:hypothetical protein